MSLLIAHTIIAIPYILRTVIAGYRGLGPTYEEAARILGAGPWRSFWHVTLPLIRPSIFAGGLFAVLISFDNLAFKLGTSLADEINSERRALGTALRKLKAATGGTTLVISRRARALLETLDRYPAGGLTAIAIRESGLVLTLDEFREIVLRASTRDQQACEQLGNVVPPIFQHFPKARGKALSAPTATHALLLMLLHDSGNPQAYTYDYGADDFVDPATLATRRAFEQQRFSPCRARRLFNELESA
jgi:hypothetical protein